MFVMVKCRGNKELSLMCSHAMNIVSICVLFQKTSSCRYGKNRVTDVQFVVVSSISRKWKETISHHGVMEEGR